MSDVQNTTRHHLQLPWEKGDAGEFGDWLYARLKEKYGKDPTIPSDFSTDEVQWLIEAAFEQAVMQ